MMMVVRIDGQVYESKFVELAQNFTKVLNEHSIAVDAIFVKGNITYLRVDQGSKRFDFMSKPIATIFGYGSCPPIFGYLSDPLGGEVILRTKLEEALGMEVNFVG